MISFEIHPKSSCDKSPIMIVSVLEFMPGGKSIIILTPYNIVTRYYQLEVPGH